MAGVGQQRQRPSPPACARFDEREYKRNGDSNGQEVTTNMMMVVPMTMNVFMARVVLGSVIVVIVTVVLAMVIVMTRVIRVTRVAMFVCHGERVLSEWRANGEQAFKAKAAS